MKGKETFHVVNISSLISQSDTSFINSNSIQVISHGLSFGHVSSNTYTQHLSLFYDLFLKDSEHTKDKIFQLIATQDPQIILFVWKNWYINPTYLHWSDSVMKLDCAFPIDIHSDYSLQFPCFWTRLIHHIQYLFTLLWFYNQILNLQALISWKVTMEPCLVNKKSRVERDKEGHQEIKTHFYYWSNHHTKEIVTPANTHSNI